MQAPGARVQNGVLMSRDYDEYTGPPPRRWAPWVLLALLAVALPAAVVAGTADSPLGAVLAILAGATMFAQVVEALRAGHVFGISPQAWPPRITRRRTPVTFWLFVAVYTLLALLFAGMGVVIGWPPLRSAFE